MAPFTPITEYLTPSGPVMIAQGTCRQATYDAFPRPGLLCEDIRVHGLRFEDGRLKPGDRFNATIVVAFKPKTNSKGYILIDLMPWPDGVPPEEMYHQLVDRITYEPRLPF